MASRLDEYVDQASAFAQENKRALQIAGITAVAATGLYLINRRSNNRIPTSGPYPRGSLPADAYDLVIVGAGPSGSTTGYFSAQAGLKVALLDKESFPRDKYCGDAVCTPAINILTEMGVMQELQKNNEAHFADAGGFVSPAGISYIGSSLLCLRAAMHLVQSCSASWLAGASVEKLGEAAACAVKRINLDMRMAYAARRAGAELREEFEVTAADFDKQQGLWTVSASNVRQSRSAACSSMFRLVAFCKTCAARAGQQGQSQVAGYSRRSHITARQQTWVLH